MQDLVSRKDSSGRCRIPFKTISGYCGGIYYQSDYFGVLSDIRSISEVCHRYHVPLLVDNAHGCHLFLMPEHLHPIHLGADITACSAHKTLPVLTGGAF